MPEKKLDNQLSFTKELGDFINFAFDDLVEVASNNPKLFDDLYYNRKNQCDEFYAMMEDSHKSAPNVLIIGGAGVGKTSFMHKLKINCNNELIYPIFIDYRKVVPKTTEGLVLSFISKIEKYFDIIKKPVVLLENYVSVDHVFQKAFNHLEGLSKDDLTKHLVIFLDDFDYAEDDWYELLKYFLPFSNNNKTSLVLSVRPNLLTLIDEYDDRFRSSYIKKARQIELAPISAENVISTRLAPILIEKSGTNKLYGLISRLFSRDSDLCLLAKKHGTLVDDLPQFEYPLSIKHNTFMQRISSGDLRETFAIAYESLKYIIDNESKLESKIEGGLQKKIIGRNGVMKIFYDNEKSNFKIINIHTQRSSKGNSLYYNILEAIKLYGIVDARFYRGLKELGHNQKTINDAVEELSSKKHKFFTNSKIIPQKLKKLITHSREYKPTPKLEMYLEMANSWDEYIERCGEPGSSFEV